MAFGIVEAYGAVNGRKGAHSFYPLAYARGSVGATVQNRDCEGAGSD